MSPRPLLPYRFANPYIKDHMSAPQPWVKYQILSCQGRDILVGRLKIDTPTESGHAFILRRYDTGAISLTTMFRAAFPNAGDNDEKVEIHWVKENFDLSGNNGSSNDPHTTRLAGTWIDPQLALELAKAYSLDSLVRIIVDATPDPNGNYRRSSKSTAATGPATSVLAPPLTSTTSSSVLVNTAHSSTVVVSKTPSLTKSLPTPSPPNKPPSKRRKEVPPVPSPATTSSVKPPSRVSASPSVSKITAVAPRRSSRKSKSPALRAIAPLPARTPKRSMKKDQSVMTPSSLDLAPVDEEGQIVEDGVAGTELMEEDIKEQKRLITELRRKEEEEAAPLPKRPDETSMEDSDHASASSKKREREDEEQHLTFEFKEREKEERVIATNSRITRFSLEPRTKSFAWGVAAFAVGMGAVTFLPSLF